MNQLERRYLTFQYNDKKRKELGLKCKMRGVTKGVVGVGRKWEEGAVALEKAVNLLVTTFRLHPDYLRMEKPSYLSTWEGAADQAQHIDLESHRTVQKGKGRKDDGEKNLVLSVIVAISPRIIFVRTGKEYFTEVDLLPGDVLVFRADLCHYGCSYSHHFQQRFVRGSHRPAIATVEDCHQGSPLLAMHVFLNPCSERNLGKQTFSCSIPRNPITKAALASSAAFPFRTTDDLHLSFKARDMGRRGKEEKPFPYDFCCQMCRHFFEIRTKKGTEHCTKCKVTLCGEVCWDYFHRGIGQEKGPTFDDYMDVMRKKRFMAKAGGNDGGNMHVYPNQGRSQVEYTSVYS